MMTTGYDCPDLLNLCLMRPIFSPTDFIQIKGRGTRKHNFFEQLLDADVKESVQEPEKIHYKLFDFFANCEYFEEQFNYDEVLKLPKPSEPGEEGEPQPPTEEYENFSPDYIKNLQVEVIGSEGMRIDRMFFDKFEDIIKDDPVVKEHVLQEQWDSAINYINKEIMDKPNEFFTLDKLS